MALKPPPGMSMMEEIKWKQQQKKENAATAAAPGAAADKTPTTPNNKAPADTPVAGKVGGIAKTWNPAPPSSGPGAAKPVVAAANKSATGAAAGGSAKPAPPPPNSRPTSVASPPKNGLPKFPPTAPATEKAKDDKPAEDKPKVAGSLASRQAMLANILGGQGGGGGPAPPKKDAQPKKDGPPPVKKWGKVETDGSGSGAAAVTTPASSTTLSKPTDLSKYEKMSKMLPQGAVENAMVRDGFDPGYMFDNCITMKSDKKPIKDQPPAAVVSSPAAVAATDVVGASSNNATAAYSYPDQQQYSQPAAAFTAGAPPPGMPYGQAPAASTWIQAWSPEYNAYFYSNPLTGESTWTAPAGFLHQQPQYAQQNPIIVMLFNFVPTGANSQEIMVYANDQIEVFNYGQDGWITGRCLRTGLIGLVPQNYTNAG